MWQEWRLFAILCQFLSWSRLQLYTIFDGCEQDKALDIAGGVVNDDDDVDDDDDDDPLYCCTESQLAESTQSQSQSQAQSQSQSQSSQQVSQVSADVCGMNDS